MGRHVPLKPLHPESTRGHPPPARALPCRLHPFLPGPLVTLSHSALPILASSPFRPCPVSRLLPTHPLATCSTQGRGRSGLALPFAKAAGLWPLAPTGRACRNMPFFNKRLKREEVRAAILLPTLSFLLQSLLCPPISDPQHQNWQGGAFPLVDEDLRPHRWKTGSLAQTISSPHQ